MLLIILWVKCSSASLLISVVKRTVNSSPPTLAMVSPVSCPRNWERPNLYRPQVLKSSSLLKCHTLSRWFLNEFFLFQQNGKILFMLHFLIMHSYPKLSLKSIPGVYPRKFGVSESPPKLLKTLVGAAGFEPATR